MTFKTARPLPMRDGCRWNGIASHSQHSTVLDVWQPKSAAPYFNERTLIIALQSLASRVQLESVQLFLCSSCQGIVTSIESHDQLALLTWQPERIKVQPFCISNANRFCPKLMYRRLVHERR